MFHHSTIATYLLALWLHLFAWGTTALFAADAALPEKVSPEQGTKKVSIDDIAFSIPASMRLVKIAAEPLIRWPVAAVWDDEGALLVLESNWNRQRVEEQLVSRPHRVVRLEDTDHDGRFDRRTVAAADLSFSAGILVVGNTLFVTAPPVILRLEDTDGDHVYDKRETWHDGKTLTFCANDLHGPMLGRDGWMYWTKGAFGEQSLETRDGKTFNSRAAHLYRQHPSGGGVEALMTGGMDNPVDVAFLPNGERLICSTFLHHPGGGVRDGIAHAIYGAMFGKPHDVLNGHPRTGPLMLPIEELGPAAPASLTYLGSPEIIESSQLFPSESFTAPILVTAQFNLQKIGIHRLIPNGATFTTLSHDLLVSDKVDFHPVKVLEDRDGSLIVLDTGGWYDLCCPSSGSRGQVAPGGIYRLSADNTGIVIKTDPPLETIDCHLGRLADSHSRIREISAQWLANHSPESIAPLLERLSQSNRSTTERLELFWCLAKTLVDQPEHPLVKPAVLQCLNDESTELQQAAANVVSLYRWQDAYPQLISLLETARPDVSRLAAECLGRLSEHDKQSIAALMKAVNRTSGDRALEHAIVYALIERDCQELIRPFLLSDSSREQWAAMMVLEQTKRISLQDADQLLLRISSDDEPVRLLASEIVSSHPEFAEHAQAFIKRSWESPTPKSIATLRAILSVWWQQENVAQQIGSWMERHAMLLPAQTDLLIETMASVRGESLPPSWVTSLAAWLRTGDPAATQRIARSLRLVKWTMPRDGAIVAELVSRINQPGESFEATLVYMAALPLSTLTKGSHRISETVLRELIDGITSENEVLAVACEAALSRVRLPHAIATELIDQIDKVAPIRLQTTILALLQVEDDNVDAELLHAIDKLPAAKAVSSKVVLAAMKSRSEAVMQDWGKTFARINAPPANVTLAVDEWLASLPAGDAVRGHQIFRSSQAACSQCHQVGYIGGKVGPELSLIGKSRTRRDLTEAILFPSARLEQSYQPTKVLTIDGRMYNGLVAKQTDTQLELICGANERCFIRLEDIELREPSDLSLMPAGLERSLTRQQFADLISFLEAAR